MYKIPNRDVFGYCVNCGKKMVGHKVVGGIYTVCLSNEHTNVTYLLNDGSQMRVGMCKTCAKSLTGDEKERKHIMKRVYRGWQHEVETYAEWEKKPEKVKKEFLEKYGQKRIVTQSDGVDNKMLVKTLHKYNSGKGKKLKNILKEK